MLRLTLLLLAGSPCRTPCGMEAPGLTRTQCRVLGLAERRALHFLSRGAPSLGTEGLSCELLAGWTVRVHPPDKPCGPDGFYFGPIKDCAYGGALFPDRVIEVADRRWFSNAFTHEVAHAVELSRSGHSEHCGWNARGVNAAIRAATGNDKTSHTSEDCRVR